MIGIKTRKRVGMNRHGLTILVTMLICFSLVSTQATEYLYPVGVMHSHDQDQLYVLYQKSPEHLELWIWDLLTKIAHKAVLSTFNPAGLQMLPSQHGFSFIDNGRIRVKTFGKGSPKAISINKPMYDISLLHWLSDELCYLSAKYQDNYGIFLLDIEGEATTLIAQRGVDCRYPSLIENNLFYIEQTQREESCNYRIMKKEICHSGEYLTTQVPVPDGESVLLVDNGTNPTIFLKMISDHEGFFYTT